MKVIVKSRNKIKKIIVMFKRVEIWNLRSQLKEQGVILKQKQKNRKKKLKKKKEKKLLKMLRNS
jgi:hypothetical protein